MIKVSNKIIFLKIAALLLTSASIVIILYFFLLKNTDYSVCESGSEVKKTSGALESMQFMSEARTFPGVDIPPEKYY